MSIPGKVLIALLSALAVAAVAAMLDPEQTLLELLVPTAVAAVLAVLLSHRALPMPGTFVATTDDATTAPSTPAASPRANSHASPAAADREQRGNERRKHDRGRKPGPGRSSEAKEQRGAPADNAAGFETGTVKWFNVSKGYGFIIRDNGEEIFVHHRSVRGEGRGRLDDGASVRFRVADTDKGPQAEDVSAL